MISSTWVRAPTRFHFFKQKNIVSGKQQVFVRTNNINNNNDNKNNNNDYN